LLPVSEWSDDETSRVAQVLVAILEVCVGLSDYAISLLGEQTNQEVSVVDVFLSPSNPSQLSKTAAIGQISKMSGENKMCQGVCPLQGLKLTKRPYAKAAKDHH